MEPAFIEPCHYCGEHITGLKLHRDHVQPLCRGGSKHIRNIVYACNVCNSIKGRSTIDECRARLIQKRIGWPRFKAEQLDWLRAKGFDMSEFDNGKLAFEEN